MVAEIFSRYYAKDVQMHSFDNAQATKAKRDNWAQLIKLFRKIGLPDIISEQEAHWIASLEEGSAVTFLCRAYEALTQRKLSLQTKPPTILKEPGYARENSIMKVRKAMQHNDLKEGYNIQQTSKIISNVVNQHEVELQEERFTDPERYSVMSGSVGLPARGSQASGLGSPKIGVKSSILTNSNSREEIPVVVAKEIQVRQLDRNTINLNSLRLGGMHPGSVQGSAQGGGHRGSNSPPRIINSALSPRPGSPQGSVSRSPVGNDRGGGGADNHSVHSQVSHHSHSQPRLLPPINNNSNQLLPENSLSLLNSCIVRVLNISTFESWSNHTDPFTNFLTAIELLSLGNSSKNRGLDDLISATLLEIENSAYMLAEACAVSPKQFWKVADLFCRVLIQAPFESRSFPSAVQSFRMIGLAITDRDPFSSTVLFADFALFKLASTISNHAQKRLGILQLLHAFAPNSPAAHVQCIKRLQGIIGQNLADFIACLNVLALQEESLDALLLDLYCYYATIGLSQPSPKLRAGSIAMLKALLPEGEMTVAMLLPTLEKLVDGGNCWWEERSQLVALAGQFLSLHARRKLSDSDSNKNPSEAVLSAITCAKRVLVKMMASLEDENNNQWLWTAQQLAAAVGYDAEVDGLFLATLQRLDERDLRFTLGLSTSNEAEDGEEAMQETEVRAIRLPSCTGIPYELQPAAMTWHSLSIARMIESIVTEQSLERLNALQVQTLYAAVRSRVSTAASGDDLTSSCLVGQWTEIFTQLKDFIFVAVCDEKAIVSAIGLLSSFMFHSELKDAILQDSRFMGIFRLLYNNDESGLSYDDAAACQGLLEMFLRDVFKVGRPFDRGVYQVLQQFSKSSPSLFAGAVSLQRLMKEFASSLN